MDNDSLYDLLDELLEKASKEQIKMFLINVINKFPDNKNKEIFSLVNEIFSDEIQEISLKDFDKKIKSIERQFDLINNYELQFHCETYETGDYEYWDEIYETCYYDPENIGSIVTKAYNLANILVTKKDYKNAKRILDLIIFTTYSVVDDASYDILDYGISDIISFDLIEIDLNKICLTVLYITLLISNNKCEDIYKYYETYMFDNIRLEDSLQMGANNLKDMDIFWKNWIEYLSKKDDSKAYKLLTEALAYNNCEHYKEVLELNKKTHPELYLFVFDYLKRLNKYEEIIEIGKSVLDDMNDDIKNQIALLVATSYKKLDSNYDISYYLYIAFLSNQSVSNLIRIINNGYLEKYKKEIELIKDDPYKNDNDFVLLYYFLGEFDTFLSFFKDNSEYLGWSYSRMNTYVELMIFLLCNEYETDIKKKLASSICFLIGINDNYNLYNASERGVDYLKILNAWKSHFVISNDTKEVYVAWLEEAVRKRVDAIVSNQHRGSYNKAAFLVCIFDECLENLKVKNKGEIIEFYERKYLKYRAFKKELNTYK